MISRSLRQKNSKSGGFTLVELLVTITIFVILTGVVLFSQSRFNSTIFLTNLAYDTALTLRQAQTYGVNIKNFVTKEGDVFKNNFTPYGVHFDLLNAPTSFILFADLDYTTLNNKITSDGVFDGTGDVTVDPTHCNSGEGCVSRSNISRGNRISDLCVTVDGTNWTCSEGSEGVKKVDVVFTRPNPDAQITWRQGDHDVVQNALKIVLSDQAGENFREVMVQSNGLIYVKSR